MDQLSAFHRRLPPTSTLLSSPRTQTHSKRRSYHPTSHRSSQSKPLIDLLCFSSSIDGDLCCCRCCRWSQKMEGKVKVRYASGKTTAKGEREREGKTNCRLQKKSICPHLAIKQLSKYIKTLDKPQIIIINKVTTVKGKIRKWLLNKVAASAAAVHFLSLYRKYSRYCPLALPHFTAHWGSNERRHYKNTKNTKKKC